MPHHRRLIFLVALAMTAFAANSLLCRLALKTSGIDAGSFTGLRLASGALVLWLIVRWRGPAGPAGGSWAAATALFIYAAGFSYAYIQLPTATGALLLFGAVQVTMIGVGLRRGERLHGWQMAGLGLAVSGLLALLTPGLSAPPPDSAALMLSAGVGLGNLLPARQAAGQPDPGDGRQLPAYPAVCRPAQPGHTAAGPPRQCWRDLCPDLGRPGFRPRLRTVVCRIAGPGCNPTRPRCN